MVEALVYIHGIIDHIRLGEKFDLGLQDLVVTVETFVLEELQEREDEVTIEEGSDAGGKVIVSHMERKTGWSSSAAAAAYSSFRRASACVCASVSVSRKETLIPRE
jgi:hypothetical protein